MSIAVPVTQPKGGQFVLHAKALHGNPFDRHRLKGAVADLERNTGVEVRAHPPRQELSRHFPRRRRSLANPAASLTPYVGRNFTDDEKRRSSATPASLLISVIQRFNVLCDRSQIRI